MARRKKSSSEIEGDLSDLAKHLIERVKMTDDGNTIPLAEEISAFRAITAYYAILKRLNPPDEDEGSFGGHAQSIADSGSGRGKGTGRPARNGTGSGPDF